MPCTDLTCRLRRGLQVLFLGLILAPMGVLPLQLRQVLDYTE